MGAGSAGLGEEKYLLLTTFKRDRTAVATPVWAVALDDGAVGVVLTPDPSGS
ncbi:MAG TPA: hypothetical protein VND44_05270 [Acidimicrobiales bacterium]|nr:hypothetical protein [Acidimicrobiales bacterium]